MTMGENLKITSQGQGTPLVFIHGWGLNSGVWQPIIAKLINQFEVITVDLPGFGNNANKTLTSYSLINVAEQIIKSIDKPAIYIGWSLGGLVATKIALMVPQKVQGLITIASSPCFVEKSFDQEKANNKTTDEDSFVTPTKWPGIKASLLAGFHQQLSQDIKKTLAVFLKIQAMGSTHIRQDIKQIQKLVMEFPEPSRATLDDSLSLLETVDLREQLAEITLPFLRLYGRLDSLIPKTVPALVSELSKTSEQHIFHKASHAPFISHPDDFFQVISEWLLKNSMLLPQAGK